MTAPYDVDGLWLKSQMFANRALDPTRGFEEQAFWACSALELLGKTALANVSPLLIAVPTDDGKSLLAASGLGDHVGFTTVQAKAVWARCKRAFKPFSEEDAKTLSYGRNDYIHSAAIGFDKVPERAWWPTYWSQADILLKHLGKSLDDYVPPNHLNEVAAHLATNRKNLAHRLEAALERARGRLAQFTADTLSARAAAEWASFTAPSTLYSSAHDCPACNQPAQLHGEEKLDTRVEYVSVDEFFDDTVVTLEIATDALACPHCHLVLTEYDLLVEAQIADTFEVEGDGDDIDYAPEYNNE